VWEGVKRRNTCFFLEGVERWLDDIVESEWEIYSYLGSGDVHDFERFNFQFVAMNQWKLIICVI
jgi:hypothetical protein